MAFRLSKAEQKNLNASMNVLSDAKDVVEARLEDLNAQIRELIDQFNGTVVEIYNQKLETEMAFVAEITERLRSEFDDHTDTWKEGEKGEVASEMVEAWEAVDGQDGAIQPLQFEDLTLDGPDEWANEALENLPGEAE
jgi:uncharacterized protein YukE